jgi:hypothetical protein
MVKYASRCPRTLSGFWTNASAGRWPVHRQKDKIRDSPADNRATDLPRTRSEGSEGLRADGRGSFDRTRPGNGWRLQIPHQARSGATEGVGQARRTDKCRGPGDTLQVDGKEPSHPREGIFPPGPFGEPPQGRPNVAGTRLPVTAQRQATEETSCPDRNVGFKHINQTA